jgi:molybdenum cofactor guanylyltransferase
MDNSRSRFSTIILAGGSSFRMGTDKGLVELKGKPMVRHIIDAVEPVCRNILIVSNNNRYKIFGYPVIKDLVSHCGPIAGIYSGLKQSTTPFNLVLGCNIPNISPGFVKHLFNKMDDSYPALVPVADNKAYPLFGIYHKASLNTFADLILNQKLNLEDAISSMDTKYLNVSGLFHHSVFSEINTKEELYAARSVYYAGLFGKRLIKR